MARTDAGPLAERIKGLEQRLEIRRRRIGDSLTIVSEHTRDTVASPKVLLGAMAAGFVLDRMSRAVKRSEPASEPVRSPGTLRHLLAAAAVALLQQSMGTQGGLLSQAVRYLWQRRKANRAKSSTSASTSAAAAADPSRGRFRASNQAINASPGSRGNGRDPTTGSGGEVAMASPAASDVAQPSPPRTP